MHRMSSSFIDNRPDGCYYLQCAGKAALPTKARAYSPSLENFRKIVKSKTSINSKCPISPSITIIV